MNAPSLAERFLIFKAQYALETPPPALKLPTKPVYEAVLSDWRDDLGAKLMLALLIAASVVVSGSHTIPTFVGDQPTGLALMVGIAAFVMVECAMIIYAYIRTKNHYTLYPDQPMRLGRWLSAGFWLAVGTAIAANEHYTLKGQPLATGAVWQLFEFAIKAVIGISAPGLAFISGDIYGLLAVTATRRERVAFGKHEKTVSEWEATCKLLEEQHAAHLAEWEAALRRSWAAEKGKQRRADIAAENLQSAVNPVKPVNFTPSLRQKPSPKLDKAVRWLQEHQDQAEKSSRELEPLIGVSHTLVTQAQQIVKSQNGHSQEVE